MGVWSQGVDPSGLVSESPWILCIISVSEMRPVLLLMIECKSVLGQHWRKILLACFLKISSPSWQVLTDVLILCLNPLQEGATTTP